MAKYYSSTFGKISGKHGTAVAVIRKDGSTYLRLHVPSTNPRTEKQQAHRAKFALTSKSLVPFNPIFKETMGITNGISTARSHAFKNAIVGEYPNLSVDYEKIMFSLGALEKLRNATHTRNEGVVTVNWDFKEMYNCNRDDSVNLVVFNKDTKQVLHIKDVAERLDMEVKIDIYDAWADSDLYLWTYVTRGDKKSDSVFVAAVEADISACPTDSYQGNECVDNNTYMHVQNVESNSIVSPVQSFVNEFVMAIIMMVCNLLTMFAKALIATKAHSFINVLSYKESSIAEYIEDSHKNIVLKFNPKRIRRAIYDELYCKYQYIFRPIRIPIVSR